MATKWSELRISAGSFDLNKWLRGGYEKDIITTLYGGAGSGKSNWCMLAAVSQAKKGKKVLFIDSEGGFSVERVRQLVGEGDGGGVGSGGDGGVEDGGKEETEKVLKNITLLNVHDFDEQKKAFNSISKYVSENFSLIIVDGMTMLYRLAMADAKNDEIKLRGVNQELARQLKILAVIAREKNIPVLITNQTYQEFLSFEDLKEGKKPQEFMVGGDLLKYWSKCIIELKNFNGKRKARIVKHRSLKEKELNFYINDLGVRRRGWI
ncbi:MAG: DNA repair and recombination protein RadB [Nanoarchaeota archaeon]|nr:DNA repair and recombination protein RadB [Nanoarchaeota archaeon]